MKSKKGWLEKSRFYVIIDKEVCARRSLSGIVSKIKGEGVDIFQYRDKISDKATLLENARKLKKILSSNKSLLIINDFLDIARIVDCDGIHLGQADYSIAVARKLLGKDKIVGISCHTLRQAKRAQANGADYIGLGPVFPTSTKPEYKAVGTDLVRQVSEKIKIPFFAIGDIRADNLSTVLSCGAKRIAVCGAICRAKDPKRAAKTIKQALYN